MLGAPKASQTFLNQFLAKNEFWNGNFKIFIFYLISSIKFSQLLLFLWSIHRLCLLGFSRSQPFSFNKTLHIMFLLYSGSVTFLLSNARRPQISIKQRGQQIIQCLSLSKSKKLFSSYLGYNSTHAPWTICVLSLKMRTLAFFLFSLSYWASVDPFQTRIQDFHSANFSAPKTVRVTLCLQGL